MPAELPLIAALKDIHDLKSAFDEHTLLVTADPKGRITYANDGFCAITQLSRDELLSQDHRLLDTAQYSKEFFQGLGSTIGCGGVWQGEAQIRGKDGSSTWVVAMIAVLLDAAGEPSQYFALGRDVKAAGPIGASPAGTAALLNWEEAVSLVGESRYRTLFDHAPDGILIADAQSRYLDANRSMCRMLGYSREELVQMGAEDIIASFERDKIEPTLVEIRTGHEHNGVWHFRRKDGSIFTAEVMTTLTPDGNLLGIIRDLTVRQKAEEELRLLTSAVVQSKESILITDALLDLPGPRVVFVNPAFTKMTGYTLEEMIGQTPRILQGPKTDRAVLRRLRRNLERGEVFDGVAVNYRKDGTEFTMEWRITPLKDLAGTITHFVASQQDITQRLKLEEQFRQAQKMEAIGTLAGGIAHDFNNILGAIIGYTELAKLGLKDNPAVRAHLAEVLTGAKRAGVLVRQILAFSRRQSSQRKPVHLREVVAEPLKLLRATLPATIGFDLDLDAPLPPVLADATEIHQVIMNLCTNAGHAMKDRPGRLGVKLESFQVDAAVAAVSLGLQPGPYVRLNVSDTGSGMDVATQARIFEPFFTTKGPGEGTGLGLAVVHGIMQNHGGAVTVYSTPGQGTVFHLYFPVTKESEPEPPAHPESAPTGRGQRILFVDDEMPLAFLGQKMLEQLNYVVEMTTQPNHALRLVQANPTAYDLIVTDLTMPGMTGTDLAQRILLLRPDLPIILVTGFTPSLTAEGIRGLGIRELLLKPLTLLELGEAVQRVLAGRAAR